MKHLKKLNGSAKYSRKKMLLITQGLCDNCNIEQSVLCLDSSDNEYGYVKICKACCLYYFNGIEHNSLKETNICRGCDNIFEISELVEKKNGKYNTYFRCKECNKYSF